jgi:hypothetical protein
METIKIERDLDFLMAADLYKARNKNLADGIKNLAENIKMNAVSAAEARKIMDKYVPKTEKLSTDVEKIRDE